MQIAAIPGSTVPAAAAGAGSSPAAAEAPFGDLLKTAVNGMNGLEQQAAATVDGLLRGTGIDVHEALIAAQKADMSFELAMAIRNKAVAAYQQVMSLQF